MHNPSITLIGAGHLGSALVRGLILSGYPPQLITVCDHNDSKTRLLVEELGVVTTATNTQAIEKAEIVILAVKPHFLKDACQEIAASVQKKRPLIISLAAVTEINSIALWLGVSDLGIVRVMTNTPMEFGKGMAALYANEYVSTQQKQLCNSIFNATGASFWINKENMLDPLTATIGSAPAYVFLFMEALQKAAMSRGIPAELAAQSALEIVDGAAELVRQSGRTFAELRAGVTTPDGVTEHSLKNISIDDFFSTFQQIYQAADERIEEIKKSENKK